MEPPEEGLSLSSYSRMVEESHAELVELVRSRQYKMPKGYIAWHHLSALVAMYLAVVKAGIGHREDIATEIAALRMTQWFLKDAPIYCLSIDLLRAVENAELSNVFELFEGFEPSLPAFLVALPNNAVRTEEGSALSFVCVHVSARDRPELSIAEGYGLKVPYLEHEGPMHVHLSSMDSVGVTLISGLTVNQAGQLYDSGRILSPEDLSASEISDANRMKKIALQCLLALAYSPELLDDSGSSSSVAKTPSRHQKQKNPSTRSPRWLRPQFSRSVRLQDQGGSHASPRPHWRSAHEKRVLVGPREKNERKVIRIGPTWVNPSE
ncbi:MAG: hypothetical protein DCF15_22825 [Phormidesmis priestleyi]|uniref:Uncharacterized protein n=1 Tax=Phormidesmis priestleyi TaxID=268141 RepID=A0A2W4WDL5_9CYAN|nr:MAG: hypothetical protein DCF15_22825 [Phormidesmis priestleyi]